MVVVVVVVADLEGFQLLIWDVGESKKGPWAERHSHRTSVSHVWWPHSFAVVRWPFLVLYWSIKSWRAARNNLQSGVSDWTLYFLRMCGRKTTACTNIPFFCPRAKKHNILTKLSYMANENEYSFLYSHLHADTLHGMLISKHSLHHSFMEQLFEKWSALLQKNLLTPESNCLVKHKADSKKVERHILNVKHPENLNNIGVFRISIGKCSVRKKRLASQKRASACDSVEAADARAEWFFHKVDIIRVNTPSA